MRKLLLALMLITSQVHAQPKTHVFKINLETFRVDNIDKEIWAQTTITIDTDEHLLIATRKDGCDQATNIGVSIIAVKTFTSEMLKPKTAFDLNELSIDIDKDLKIVKYQVNGPRIIDKAATDLCWLMKHYKP